MTEIRTFQQIDPQDIAAVGGKAMNLALMARAGLPVPPGFCISTAAFCRLRGKSPADDAQLFAAIMEKVRELGIGPLAVRSSAAAEDGTLASFAGQQETILGVFGESQVLDAITRCWASLESERAVAYRTRHRIDDSQLAMAVIVQRLVASDVAGVLFTRDPFDPAGARMLVEASWGLGESVASGRITPDRFHLERETGKILEQHVHKKTAMLTTEGAQPVPPEKQSIACLEEHQLRLLAELGRKVEAYFEDGRDIEWAWAQGRLWLLQARPITAADSCEREQVRCEEMQALAARAAPPGTVWSRFNLFEVLPEPTPMTWALVRWLMSGQGGYGMMYRDLGAKPDPTVDEEGIFDLVCGRPYCNLTREPRMQFGYLPLEHPFSVLKADPQKAIYPQPVFNLGPVDWRLLFSIPWITLKLARHKKRIRNLSRSFASQFRDHILPRFLLSLENFTGQDLPNMEPGQLLDVFSSLVQLVLIDFARDSLKPAALAAASLTSLKLALTKSLSEDRTRSALAELSGGAQLDPEADLPAALCLLRIGKLSRTEFLQQFGHRAGQEMELAQPRWAEDSASVDWLLASAASSDRSILPDPLHVEATCERIASEAKLTASQIAELKAECKRLHQYLGVRETAKHYWMKGYALIRRVLVEMDRRQNLNGGIFYLLPEELPRLLAGKEDFASLIRQRRRRRAVALSLEAPPVIFSDDLEAIGRPSEVTTAGSFQGIPLSAGAAEAPALVLHEPSQASVPSEPYILVCPSTDPAWVPLFLHARGLVMGTGGVLSHGAIVAREFGLPAVAGLPDILRQIQTSQRIRVDGNTGKVTLL
jgi:pyruvate,water dikinase